MENKHSEFINGTLIWYNFICEREVWLMIHSLEPDQDNSNIEIGRFLHENSYKHNKKELLTGNMKLDLVKKENGELIVAEVKKSLRFNKKSAMMQLLFYITELEKLGIFAKGQILVPQEKKVEDLEITSELLEELEKAKENITKIASWEKPPLPKKIGFCRNCGYSEFCWA